MSVEDYLICNKCKFNEIEIESMFIDEDELEYVFTCYNCKSKHRLLFHLTYVSSSILE